MNITIISGSPRQGSLSNRVALNLQNHLSNTTDHTINLVDVRDWSLPPIQAAWTNLDKVPEAFRPLAETIFDTDAFILVSPEYNGSYSPALKSLLDYFPKQQHKVMAIATASPGAMGGIRASQQMQLLIAALFGVLSPHMLITPLVDKKFDEAGNLIDSGFQKAIDQFVKEFLWLAERVVTEPAFSAS